tara:strand:- start:269 stop:643 length:375 start_codon:yes stop_codon:yes gene_type:complete
MDLSEEDNGYVPKLNNISTFKKLNEISLKLDKKKDVEDSYRKVSDKKIKLNNDLFENTIKEKKAEEKKVETLEDKINNLNKWKDDITFKMNNLEKDNKNTEEINNLKLEINKITSILEFLVGKN